MHEKHVCNLLGTLPKPPWTAPINWQLHMTMDGEELIPFDLYVQQPDTGPSSHSSLFPKFCQLPAELQLRILSYCSTATLFRLMQASCTLRIEASKLFWANHSAYYLVKDSWLLEGGHPGSTWHDLSFAMQVQHIEIECSVATMINSHIPKDFGLTKTTVQKFWDSLKKRFPSAKKVVFNQNWESTQMWTKGPVSWQIQYFGKFRPPDIEISAFVLEEQKPHTKNPDRKKSWQRSVYKPVADHEWEYIASKWDRSTILMPLKQCCGPVGEFVKHQYLVGRNTLRGWAYRSLFIEAIERYHFEGRAEPFSCPIDHCDYFIDHVGQWTTHAVTAHRTGSRLMPLNKGGLDGLPDGIKGRVEKHLNELKEKQGELMREQDLLRAEWSQNGGEKREEVERKWMEQLENDEAWNTGVEPRESIVWQEYLRNVGLQ